MTVSSSLKEAVEQKNLRYIRSSLTEPLFVDRNLKKGGFLEALKYVEDYGIKIREDHLVGSLIYSEGKDLTIEDYANAVTELEFNFCDERIEDVKKIGEYLDKKEGIHRGGISTPGKLAIVVGVIVIAGVIYYLAK